MIDMRLKSKELLRAFQRAQLTQDDQDPLDPHWFRAQFPDDYKKIEGYLHIMPWQDFLDRLCREIQTASRDDAINYDYIDRDAKEIQIVDHIHAHLPKGSPTCYFDTEAPLDEYSSFVTPDTVYAQALDYQGPQGVEWYHSV